MCTKGREDVRDLSVFIGMLLSQKRDVDFAIVLMLFSNVQLSYKMKKLNYRYNLCIQMACQYICQVLLSFAVRLFVNIISCLLVSN